MDHVEIRLRRVVFEFLKLPVREGNAFLYLLLRSPAKRAIEIRHQFAASSENDLPHIFGDLVTPAYMMALVNDLRVMRRLFPRQVRIVQDALLAATTATGQWRE